MTTGYFTSEQLAALNHALDQECAEYAREHGHVTAVQRNLIAARLMEAAKENPPPRASLTMGQHGA